MRNTQTHPHPDCPYCQGKQIPEFDERHLSHEGRVDEFSIAPNLAPGWLTPYWILRIILHGRLANQPSIVGEIEVTLSDFHAEGAWIKHIKLRNWPEWAQPNLPNLLIGCHLNYSTRWAMSLTEGPSTLEQKIFPGGHLALGYQHGNQPSRIDHVVLEVPVAHVFAQWSDLGGDLPKPRWRR
ncbi:MAG: hypothetical protein AAB444_01300 [Patescibacteria group bacterium]